VGHVAEKLVERSGPLPAVSLSLPLPSLVRSTCFVARLRLIPFDLNNELYRDSFVRRLRAYVHFDGGSFHRTDAQDLERQARRRLFALFDGVALA
jgi:hypothetical protein